MAATLESVMRLTDEYTATMRKIIQSADSGKKSIGGAEKGAVSFGQSLKNLGAQSGGASSGINGLITKLGAVVSATYLAKKGFDFLWESIRTGATQQTQRSTFQSLMGNQTLGNDVYSFVSAYAKKSALDRESLSSATTSFLAFTHDGGQLKQMLDLVQRLYMFNPEQGAEGAVFALKEVLTGQTMSLKNRFNMNGVSAEKIQDFASKGDIAGTINYLDRVFNKFGATQGVVDANFQSLTVQMQLFKSNLMSALGDESNGAVIGLSQTFQQLNSDMDAGKFQPFFSAMSAGMNALANVISWVAQNADFLVPVIGGVVTALVVFNTAMSISRNIAALTGATIQAVAGNWIGAAALIAGAAATIGLSASLSKQNDGLKKTAASLTTAQAAAKLAADQKSQGASTVVPTKITNDPVKVSGTVEIEKENLKYVFEAAAAKFYASFNATKVDPTVVIQNQNVTQTADLDEVDRYLGSIVSGRAAVSAGGSY